MHKIPLFMACALLLLCSAPSVQAADTMTYPHLKSSDHIQTVLEHPAFAGFAQQILPRDSDASRQTLPLSQMQSLLPYHRFVDSTTVLNALNHMIDDAADGHRLFYAIYSDEEIQRDPDKNATGLFFFRGKPGAPFAIICPGGGFSYVGSVHEGFPYAVELSKHGFNAFVLRYRVGQGGTAATRDLAAAITTLVRHAPELGVSSKDYSLWGSSAGARMVASIGSHGVSAFTDASERDIPRPATVVMAYTGHSDVSRNDPPTFVTVSEDDPIASPAVMERRVEALRRAGIDVEYHKFRHAGHGFGLGTGTDAEGWIEHAIAFWKQHITP